MTTPRLSPRAGPRRQRGAVAVMVGIVSVILIMMLGLVLDLGHLYVVKTEMQNAADACALAAVWEMAPYNDTADARAKAAGKAVGTLNRVNFQSAAIEDGDWEIKFAAAPEPASEADWADTLAPTHWYVRCRPKGAAGFSVAMWFIQVWGVLSQGQATYESAVTASAVAGVRPCAFPLAFTSTLADPRADENYGFTKYGWYGGKLDVSDAQRGQFGWLEFGGCHSASCLADQIAGSGFCDALEKEAVPFKTGDITKIVQAWNTRFGLYRGSFKDRDAYRPDTTGYGYSRELWNRVPPPTEYAACDKATGECNVHADYENRQKTNVPFQLADFVPAVTGYHDSDVAKEAELAANGVAGRRLVVMPVVSSSAYDSHAEADIYAWACGLMLSPVSGNEAAGSVEISVEFLGPLMDSPCIGKGATGRTIIPQLVR